jgi:chromosome segregation ATPase
MVGKGNVFRAIDLVEYEPKFKDAMEYIFGRCFVVKDSEVSKKVC